MEKSQLGYLIRRTQILVHSERELDHSLTRLLPTIITTAASGARRIFSSLTFTFHRSAASTATQDKNLLSCTVSINKTRHYAKKRRMPPKKAAKEEKILLGRPGNNLKSGIVCQLITPTPIAC
jgi:hypothetical protein